MTSRRAALKALAGLALPLSLPLPSLAQQKRAARIGVLAPGETLERTDRFKYFLSGMRDLGYSEDRNLTIVWRYAEKAEYLPERAGEMVKLNIDVIVTTGTPAVEALRHASNTMPIVATSFSDPVGSGFAVSLSRPGRNVTGLTNMAEEIYIKRVETLLGVIPKATRIAWLINADNHGTARLVAPVRAALQRTGKEVIVVSAKNAAEIDTAFAAIARDRAAGLVADDTFLNAHAVRIAELALRQQLPSIFAPRRAVEAGGLMSYGFDSTDTYYRAATLVHKILNGAKPGDLPIEQPTKFDLVLNLKTAKALGLTIPQDIRLRADKVIE
jgi:putative ABC transport system substrate-binding protein